MSAAFLVVATLIAGPAPNVEETPNDAPTIANEAPTTTVRARRKKSGASIVSVPAEEARQVPGTEGDVAKVVHDLPGVARAPFGSGQLVVWGADPADTRVEIDGVEVPALFHFGGLSSVINSELVDDVTLVPGAYGVDHGRAIGGVVEVTTRDLPRELGAHASASADVIGGSALVSGAVPDWANARAAIAGRVTWLDSLLALAPHTLTSGIGDFVPIPRSYDAQAKTTFSLRDDEEISFGALLSGDALDRTVPAEDPSEVRTQSVSTSFARLYARYTHGLDDGARLVVTPWVGYDVDDEATSTGAVSTSLDVSSVDAGMRASYRRHVIDGATIVVGLDALDANAHVKRAGTIGIPAREGDDVAFGQAPPDDVNADEWDASTLDVAPFASTELRVGSLTLTPGVRADAYALGASRRTPRFGSIPSIGLTTMAFVIDPRVAVDWRATDDATLFARAGTYHQPRAPEDTSAVFGTPDLGLEKSTHAALGATNRLTSMLTLETTLYLRHSEQLVVRSASPTPNVAHALVQNGTGDDVGATLLLRQKLASGLFGWIAYTLSRSERTDADHARARLSDFDQTHTLSAVASYEIGAGFTVGARARAATGYPRTPVAGAYYDAKDDRFEPLFAAKAATSRLPPFFDLDVRGEYALHVGPVDGSIYSELLNVTFAKNAEEIAYDFTYSQHAFITGLPFLAVVGARVSL